MAAAAGERFGPVPALGAAAFRAVAGLGDLAVFTLRTLGWAVRRRTARGTLLASCYAVGVRSVPVVAVTGTFIGMVLAVQTFDQFQQLGVASRIGSVINMSIVRELGPVLAATMLAGRVGSAMAAELATMRVSEQIDALACLGANPVHHLVVPRLWACVLLIPPLTALADVMGVLGGALICTRVYHIDPHQYWQHAGTFVTLWDVGVSLVKPLFFGAAIALVGCYRGLNSAAGAEGVGRASTQAFVISFVAILGLDFLLAMFLGGLYVRLWPGAGPNFL
jgi:phospholipid/cholesterol/gamma-HCH transport system permease protein